MTESRAAKVQAVWAETLSPSGNLIMGDSKTNGLPWPTNRADLRHFRETTRNTVMVMGRRTFESLPELLKTPKSTAERPLVVLTEHVGAAMRIWSDYQNSEIVPIVPAGPDTTVDHVIAIAGIRWPGKNLSIIGGAGVIELFEPATDTMVISSIQPAYHYEGDVKSPFTPPWSVNDNFAVNNSDSRALAPDFTTYVYRYERV